MNEEKSKDFGPELNVSTADNPCFVRVGRSILNLALVTHVELAAKVLNPDGVKASGSTLADAYVDGVQVHFVSGIALGFAGAVAEQLRAVFAGGPPSPTPDPRSGAA